LKQIERSSIVTSKRFKGESDSAETLRGDTVDLPALVFTQHGMNMYITYLDASTLADEHKLVVDSWSPRNKTGYQREMSSYRAGLYAKFILNKKNISPPSILLSVRKPLHFTPVESGSSLGTLAIPDDAPLYIVDGQHRISGIRRAMVQKPDTDYCLPAIVIFHRDLGERDPSYCEAKQFVVINRTQKKVRADLHDRFVARLTVAQRKELKEVIPTPDAELTQRAVEISDKLNSDPRSVWHKLIKVPAGGRSPGVISQRTVTEGLKKSFLRDEIVSQRDDSDLLGLINDWWGAWATACPEAFDPNTRGNYVLQGNTVAFRVVNELLRTTLRFFPPKRWAQLTRKKFLKFIRLMDEGNYSSFWGKGGTASQYRGEGGIRDLLATLREPLVSKLM